jgi:hypothetical protein
MATTVSDPLTDTEWVDPGDPTGTVMTWVVALVGLGILFTIISVAQATVTPALTGFADQVPFVRSGEGNVIRVAE